MKDIVQRFLKYVSFDTQSSENNPGQCPSTEKQFRLAEYLLEELKAIGMQDVEMDSHGYVFATLPASEGMEQVPVVGFIAHMDTSPDCSGTDVKPHIIENYDGTDIVLDAKEGIVTKVSQFPELLHHKGEDIIVTDGHTLLGADDKAGIAEITSAMAYLIEHPEVKHGKVRVCFNPDEEIGCGAHLFDVEKFGCEWAYTMDGSEVGELEYENFNAASAKITINGISVHPGYAKDKMVNAALLATEFAQQMPENEVPERTTGYEGFFHLYQMQGGVEQATLTYIIRDHNREIFEQRMAFMKEVEAKINAQYGAGVVALELKEQYRNMREMVEPKMHIIDIAKSAMEKAGVVPVIKPIRGGTDGAQLSFMGLPCPNLFAGGVNFHSRYEFVSVQVMEKAVMTIVNIAAAVAGCC